MILDSDRSRARRLALDGNFGAEALSLNASLVGRDPTDHESRTRLGRCYREAGRLTEAEAEYREVLRQNPKNRIAASGLESLQPPPPPPVRQPAAPRGARSSRLPSAPRTVSPGLSRPVRHTFTGFSAEDFADLRLCSGREAQTLFGPRVVDLVKRVNALPSSREHAAVRDPGQRALFHTALSDVHPGQRLWQVFNHGGRWEPQFNIGMHAGEGAANWLRVGLGLNLSAEGRDDAEEGHARVLDYFRALQALLAPDRRHVITGWMVREGGLLEYQVAGPRLDLRDPVQAAAMVAGADAERTHWVFFGKWLFLDNPDDAEVLADAVALVRTIERAFVGLAPAFRALMA
jgi:hypothetical protein